MCNISTIKKPRQEQREPVVKTRTDMNSTNLLSATTCLSSLLFIQVVTKLATVAFGCSFRVLGLCFRVDNKNFVAMKKLASEIQTRVCLDPQWTRCCSSIDAGSIKMLKISFKPLLAQLAFHPNCYQVSYCSFWLLFQSFTLSIFIQKLIKLTFIFAKFQDFELQLINFVFFIFR